MGPRFTLRWTIIGLVSFLPLVIASIILANLAYVRQQAQPRASINDEYFREVIGASAEMPLSATGSGTQMISGTTVCLQIQPFPVVASNGAITTMTLSVVTPDGHPALSASPELTFHARTPTEHDRTYTFTQLPGGVYRISGVFFTAPGQSHMRIDVNIGDAIPAPMIFTVDTK